VVQKYVHKPLTVGGKKFDMRIYLLVTSWSPLEAWLHRDGFCRFSMFRYSSKTEDMDNITMHLTNNAIQKKSEGYGTSNMGDCKWPLLALRMHVARKYGQAAADSCFLAIQQILLRSLFACQQVRVWFWVYWPSLCV
jgi:tubulin polyglutamylase TTLL9